MAKVNLVFASEFFFFLDLLTTQCIVQSATQNEDVLLNYLDYKKENRKSLVLRAV